MSASLAGVSDRKIPLQIAVGILFVCSVLGAQRADAIEAEAKLKVTKFSFQTTSTRSVAGPLSHENWGFENEPVLYTQAGGHPNGQGGTADSLTATIEFESQLIKQRENGLLAPVPTGDPKDIAVTLPQGFLGNPTAVERCPLKIALSFSERCPAAAQVGEAVVYLGHGEGLAGPIVNVVPEAGQSAEFAIETNHKINFVLTGHVVHTSLGYTLVVDTNSITMAEIYRVETSFWGVPAAAVHDRERGRLCNRLFATTGSPEPSWFCLNGEQTKETGGESVGSLEVPFLTLPDDCAAGPGVAVVRADSWEEPGVFTSASTEFPAEKIGVSGCNLLQFEPGVGVEPDSLGADEPVGLGVNLSVPQFEQPGRLATPEVSRTVLSLPSGVSISPGVVDGIRACNESGPEGINFTGPESEEVGLSGELQLAPGHCPDASILGTVEAETPLLSVPIKGHVFLARPGCGGTGQAPCEEKDVLDGRLYQLYLELGGTGALGNAGVNIKVRLKTEVDPSNGQLTTVAEEIAQLPFSNLRVRLNGGPRAPIDNPPTCGPAVTNADFSTWAAPGETPEKVFVSGLGDVTSSSVFDVGGCAGPPGLSPMFLAGTVTPNAAKFTAFTLNIARKDREQYVRGVEVHTPAGLLGMLSSVPLCGDAEANSGSCPEASRIGTTRVASGAGSHPFEIEGNMYLTGPHGGAPFGLSVVTNVVAGPFNLGRVVVRARIEVDENDSTLRITTDESGPYALPQIVFGVPLRLQRITVDVDRRGFMFNPTNCSAQQITARISGFQGTVASVTSPFAVGGCRSLRFKPVFHVSTSARTSRANGASLDARLSYPKGALGNDANVARAKVSLPRQLPSRLSTLQKACPVLVFTNDPAACPKASVVGKAWASTPVLPVGLEGPVYFVSFGGEAFPQLIVVLQGDGVRVDLAGNTFISRGITSSTFKTVPDVPVNSFELYLPQGKYSALAANGNLCRAQSKLVMPTEFVAQNGMAVRQETKIAVTGCGKMAAKGKANNKKGRSARNGRAIGRASR